MKTIIYHNPRCSKSRETLELLKEHGEQIEIVEYLKNTPSEKELGEIISKLGIKPELLVRKSETLYKEKFAGKTFTDKQWIKILSENPVLIERPVVVKGNKAVIGRPPQNIIDIL